MHETLPSFEVYALVLKSRFGVLFPFKPRIRVVLHIADHINVYRDVPELTEPIIFMVAIWQPGTIKSCMLSFASILYKV